MLLGATDRRVVRISLIDPTVECRCFFDLPLSMECGSKFPVQLSIQVSHID